MKNTLKNRLETAMRVIENRMEHAEAIKKASTKGDKEWTYQSGKYIEARAIYVLLDAVLHDQTNDISKDIDIYGVFTK